ncbi:hypothetical protein BDU57DRAFT_553708 [Ampelomyces quisqualis]|uniref:Chitin-binding type-4 domain-containing protein n=1 Tax=Ampelomyces quisqualis TaxID=50730 RepID=A0A6A5R3M0_AMPQU|nr:hypothetical protein BDU57DRAFT_553708 [Ampelomyces quisqualis]
MQSGPQHKALCGSPVVTELEKDLAGPIENAMKKADSSYTAACNAYLCRGYQFADNASNARTVKTGDEIAFHVDIVAGHRPARANVSIVDTKMNEVLAEDFNVTIPALGSECQTKGRCAIQWFWYVPKGTQTYESCVDIVTA